MKLNRDRDPLIAALLSSSAPMPPLERAIFGVMRDIVGFMKTSGAAPDTVRAISGISGLTDDDVARALAELESRGLVEQVTKGKWSVKR